MNRPWEKTRCDEVAAYYTHYPILDAAILWCGVPASELHSIKAQCSEGMSRGIYTHSDIQCIEPKCRAMHQAIHDGELACGRDGVKPSAPCHVAPERRTVSREDLKQWIAKTFPASKPAFLFDEVERTVHSAITKDAYQSVVAERDRLKKELEQTKAQPRANQADTDARLKLCAALIETIGLTLPTATAAELNRRVQRAGYTVSPDICERLLKAIRARMSEWTD